MKTNKHGFTLIELMIVIMIIGVLAAVGLVMYASVQKSARDSKRMQDVDAIQRALEQNYVAKNRTYPDNFASGPRVNFTTTQYFLDNFKGYFSRNTLPADPGNNIYNYYQQSPVPAAPATCTTPRYAICATLETAVGNYSAVGDNTKTSCDTSAFTTGAGNYYCAFSLSE